MLTRVLASKRKKGNLINWFAPVDGGDKGSEGEWIPQSGLTGC